MKIILKNGNVLEISIAEYLLVYKTLLSETKAEEKNSTIIKKYCKKCGNEVVFPRYKFCSERCGWEWHNKHQKNRKKILQLQKVIRGTCEKCGREYIKGRSTQKFCSGDCRTKYYDDNRKAKKQTAINVEQTNLINSL